MSEEATCDAWAKRIHDQSLQPDDLSSPPTNTTKSKLMMTACAMHHCQSQLLERKATERRIDDYAKAPLTVATIVPGRSGLHDIAGLRYLPKRMSSSSTGVLRACYDMNLDLICLPASRHGTVDIRTEGYRLLTGKTNDSNNHGISYATVAALIHETSDVAESASDVSTRHLWIENDTTSFCYVAKTNNQSACCCFCVDTTNHPDGYNH